MRLPWRLAAPAARGLGTKRPEGTAGPGWCRSGGTAACHPRGFGGRAATPSRGHVRLPARSLRLQVDAAPSFPSRSVRASVAGRPRDHAHTAPRLPGTRACASDLPCTSGAPRAASGASGSLAADARAGPCYGAQRHLPVQRHNKGARVLRLSASERERPSHGGRAAGRGTAAVVTWQLASTLAAGVHHI